MSDTSTGKTLTSLVAFVIFVILLFMTLGIIAFQGFVGIKVWEWYIGDILGWVPTFSQMCGFAFLGTFLFPIWKGKQASFAAGHFFNETEQFKMNIGHFVDSIFRPFIVFVIAWIGHITFF